MTILWITENYYPNQGGMAQSCDRIVSGLRANNIAVDVIHLVKKSRRRTKGNSVIGHDYSWELSDQPSHGLNMLWNWLEQQTTQYSKVVAFGSHYALIAARNYSSWLDIPLVTMVRGNDFDTAIFDSRRRPLIADVYTNSQQVICVSQDKVRKIARLFPEVNVNWIANGIDLSLWRPMKSYNNRRDQIKSQFPANRRVLGMIGDLKAKKGGKFLLENLEISGLSEQFHLLLVGNLDDAITEHLNHSDSKISYTHVPFLERHQLIPYYLSCDCLAIPSFYDGMPNVLLEGGGLGRPILAANTGGMKDILSHGQDALLFEPGDPHQLRQCLYQLAQMSHEALEQLGSNCQTMISEQYTVERESRSYQLALAEQANLELELVAGQ